MKTKKKMFRRIWTYINWPERKKELIFYAGIGLVTQAFTTFVYSPTTCMGPSMIPTIEPE